MKKVEKRVKTPNCTTKWYNVEAGVIQGSVLGPILFIIFLSDINSYIPPNIKAPKYADDITTYCIYNKSTENNIQQAADGVRKWSEDNKMKLNVEKTQSMHFNNNNQQTIKINDHEITTTTSYKYLGTHLNTKLDWDIQWEVLNKKFHCTLYLIKTLKNSKEVLEKWNDLTPLARNEFICWITSAKKEETRIKRIEKTKSILLKGKRRPCCWPGCPHRRLSAKK